MPYSFSLMQEAMDRGAVIVVLRAWREWQVAIPGLRHYERLVRTKSTQTSHLTPRNIDPPEKWQFFCKGLSGSP